MSDRPCIGVIPLGRQAFDVEFAEEVAERAFETLDGLDARIAGPRHLLYDAGATRDAIRALKGESLDLLLVLQVTFTDATMTAALAEEISAPLAFWAFPEGRTGGRLRLNSFCGINLAGHALGKQGRRYDWIYRRPDDPAAGEELRRILEGRRHVRTPSPKVPEPTAKARGRAAEVRKRLAGTRIGVIGRHPDGFVTCEYDTEVLAALTGARVEQLELPALFDAALAVPDEVAARSRQRAERTLDGLDDLDPESLDRSLRLHAALDRLAEDRGLAGVAVRCWPECFTEYGSAICTPMAMLNESGTPGICEADTYGIVTALILQWLASEPSFIADLVDLDVESDTGIFWHCGSAPIHMADPDAPARATIHSNRRKPLLNEFPLKPGRVTVARLSQAQGRQRLVIGGGEVLKAPLPFAGTSGVTRFDRPAGEVLDTVMGNGLEHHYGLVYGDLRAELRALADELGIPVIDLTG
jgi:L-fucose isomerase-like protein